MIKIILTLMLLLSTLAASQKAVFDCAAGNTKYVQSRMYLIEETAKELEMNETPYEFVITIHSKCTPIVDKNDKDKHVQAIHKRLKTLTSDYNVKVKVCKIAADRFGYERSDIPSYIDIVQNSITEVIKLQNDGYAFIPYH